MLHGDRNHIRDLGIQQILKARQSLSPIRKFKASSLNFECNDYAEKFNWAFEKITESPLTRPLSPKRLLELHGGTSNSVIPLKNCPW